MNCISIHDVRDIKFTRENYESVPGSIHEGFSVIGCVAEDVRGTRFTMKMFVPRDFDPIKSLNFCEAVSSELVDETT